MAEDEDSGLLVKITPSQSAFFAGELFSATITFSNPAPVVAAPSLHALHSLSQLPPPHNVAPSQVAGGARQHGISSGRGRPPSASHLGLAEYASSHLDADEVPPSPFIGSNGFSAPLGGYSGGPGGPREMLEPLKGKAVSTMSGGALRTPQSATFALPPYAQPSPRAASGTASPVASTSKSTLPTRKGLIGKPIPKSPEKRPPGGGLYPGGPRRPGDQMRGHGRTQSMAVSSPDLLGGHSAPVKGHGRSRLGGSVAGDLSALQGLGTSNEKGKASASRQAPTAIDEEPDSSFAASQSSIPSSNTTPATSVPSFSTSQSSVQKYPYSSHPQQRNDPSSTFSSTELSDDGASDYDPSEFTTAGRGFYGLGQNDTMDSVVREGVEDWTRRTTQEGPATFGSYAANAQYRTASSQFSTLPRPANNSFLHPSNTLNVLWSFAHLEGTFEVDDLLIKPSEFIEIKRSLLGGAGTGIGIGGGTLEEPTQNKGWKSWLWGAADDVPKKPGGAATLEERRELTMKEKTVPTFSSPPSILGVDLVLLPGESKSYSFSIRVPADLPPSFRGKAIKFSYHLVVGTNRCHPGGPMTSGAGSTKDSISRVMRVPVRVYNHVAVTGARPFYDLTNPIVYHRDEAITSDYEDPKMIKKARRPSIGLGRAEFEAYSAALLDSMSDPLSPTLHPANPLASPTLRPMFSPSLMEALPALRPEMRSRSAQQVQNLLGNGEDENVGCKSAVEIVSRNSQKVSYDINKDGYMVASLTLVKSAYRLGETVNGSVVINSGEGRVIRVSARLETHELIETSIATRPAPQIRQTTRRLHAEHHEMTLDSARIGFALAIPSGATPDFATSGVKLQWSVRLSFLVIPPSPDAPLASKTGPPMRSGRSGAPPLHALPPPSGSSSSSSARHGRSKSFGYGFEPAVSLTLPAAPLIQPTGAAHLMPVYGPSDSSPAHVSYRAVPDLGFVPVLFGSRIPEAPPPPGPLQRSASGGLHKATASLSGPAVRNLGVAREQANVVLVPAKVETVECSIPIKVYPGNTPFRPTISIFEDIR